MTRRSRRRGWRRLLIAGAVAAALVGTLLGYGLWLARSMPVVRGLALHVAGWPRDRPPLRIVLATDLHVSDLGASRRRLARIVTRMNALRPDLILLGGDYVGGEVEDQPGSIADALAPLTALKAPFGTLAILGNHDHHAGAVTVRRALQASGVRVLANGASTAGPLTIGGVDDILTHHGRLPSTEEAMARRTGAMVMLSHSPDVFPLERLPIPLTLAGHTHCGQIALPWYGAIVVPTHFRQYSCGVYRLGGRTLVVSAGTGTSQIPIRLFAPPDLWLITVGP